MMPRPVQSTVSGVTSSIKVPRQVCASSAVGCSSTQHAPGGVPQTPAVHAAPTTVPPPCSHASSATMLQLKLASQQATSAGAQTLAAPQLSPLCHEPLVQRSEEHTSELQSRGHLVCR